MLCAGAVQACEMGLMRDMFTGLLVRDKGVGGMNCRVALAQHVFRYSAAIRVCKAGGMKNMCLFATRLWKA